jgi:hypothetical protein
MKVALGTFARSGIEVRFGSDAKAGIEAALRHYTRRLKSSRPPLAVPSFARDCPPADDGGLFDLVLGQETEEAMTDAAREQGVSTDLLAGHAVLVYLADLDTNLGDFPVSPTEEDAALPRYQRRCVSSNTGLRHTTRRQVGSA